MKYPLEVTRRKFLGASALTAGGLLLGCSTARKNSSKSPVSEIVLPAGSAPDPIPFPHFPSRLHAFVWRNWQLVPAARIAEVVGAKSSDILRLGAEMGLQKPPRITTDQQRRSYITVIRRNWHLLPYEQLLQLLDWTPDKMEFTLRHDDGLFWKLGSLKPKCAPLKFIFADEAACARSTEIARQLSENFPEGVGGIEEPLFQFVADLSSPMRMKNKPRASRLSPRFCYSYFSLFGDPLLDGAADPYPDGYLARLAESGVDGVWLHTILSQLAPFPWDAKESEHFEQRLKNLRALVARARRHGIKVYLYLNEPRAQPLKFFESRPHLKGVEAANPWESGNATLCTSVPEVQKYLTNSIAHICRAVPDLGGFFSITASENLSNCWSHNGGSKCPRCSQRSPSEVISELNTIYFEGIRRAGNNQELIVWDWGWNDAWAEEIINHLPKNVSFMSVSEWSIPINRGGVKSVIGEYSISTIGPGPRATRHWKFARQRGLKTIAKIQAGNTWELSTVPYIPALENVAKHAANLRDAKVDGLMLGWSLGGYPSPNLEVVAELGGIEEITPQAAMEIVARRRFGSRLAPSVVQAWHEFSAAFGEFPFGSGLYQTPMQTGPANLLWGEPTKYPSGAVGLPYDDFTSWRGQYPPEIFIGQLDKVATGFEKAFANLTQVRSVESQLKSNEREAFEKELSVAEAAAIHFRSATNQCRFVQARDRLAAAKTRPEALPQIDILERVLSDELALAKRLHAIQSHDSRIGFEASNHYYYVPLDLAEKVINCEHLLRIWLPEKKARWANV